MSHLQVHAPNFVPRLRNSHGNAATNNQVNLDLISDIRTLIASNSCAVAASSEPALMPLYLGGQSSPLPYFPSSTLAALFRRTSPLHDSDRESPMRSSSSRLVMEATRPPALRHGECAEEDDDERYRGELSLTCPMPCAGCKLNWITGAVKQHHCTFSDQYALARTDFQTALQERLLRLVERLAALATLRRRDDLLFTTARAIGLSADFIAHSIARHRHRSYDEQARCVFLSWTLRVLGTGASEQEVFVRLAHELYESGKRDLVELLWGVDKSFL